MITATEIMQEALEVSLQKYPKSFLEKLFHREPSESKLKSSAIRYLTDKVITSREKEEKATLNMYRAIQEAVRYIEQRSPEDARMFRQKFLPTNE